jgi:antitoxin component of MazEF toxin-antitoxin module
MEQIDSTNAVMIGGSIYVRIPAPACKLMEIIKGTGLKVYRDGNKLIYERVITNATQN